MLKCFDILHSLLLVRTYERAYCRASSLKPSFFTAIVVTILLKEEDMLRDRQTDRQTDNIFDARRRKLSEICWDIFFLGGQRMIEEAEEQSV